MTKQTEALRMAIQHIEFEGVRDEEGLYVLNACKEALEPTVAELNDEYLRDTHVEGMPKAETQHWLCLDGQMVVAQLYNLVEILNDPMKAYPHNFSTPAKANALLFGLCQEAADEIERLKAETQEPKPPTILARLPNEATVSNVYEAYEARLKEGKAETQEPVAWLYYHNRMVEPLVLEFEEPDTTKQFESDVTWKKPLYTTPSREWQSLSVEEIEEAVNYLNVKIDYPIMFARLIEMHLKAKNNE
jgi:uncharacterized small protein (DUF1192 family)